MRLSLLVITLTLAAVLPAQDLVLFELFTDGAVLQREVDHPVWGWSKPNRRITVTLDAAALTTRTDGRGRWELQLPPTPAGGPHTLSVSDGRTTRKLEDIYFGDVYLLSGQSNMVWRLAQSDPDSTRARAIADPMIRQVLVAKTAQPAPGDHLELAEPWKAGYPAEIADFSGVGAYFAHYIRQSGVEVPIGLLHSSWGGSRIEAWMPASTLQGSDLGSITAAEARRKAAAESVRQVYRATFGDGIPPEKDQGQAQGYLAAETDLTHWGIMEVPGPWEGKGYPEVDGVFYFRRTFLLTEEQAAAGATLHLGPIDDGDITYLNGTLVGTTPNAYAEARRYTIAGNQLRAGSNSLAVRVIDTGGGGGFTGSPDSLYLQAGNGDRIPLSGTYHYRIGALHQASARANHTPSLLYNAMIAPLADWPLTGVLWYQGESNAGPDDAPRYANQMRALVHAWRDQFASDSLPFYWVQLANYLPTPQSPDEPGWALLRSEQTAALDIPHTGQAVITDLGEADDIHPRNKWEVGRRLSLLARRDIYGHTVEARSPTAATLEIHEAYAIVRFADTGKGLTLKGYPGNRYPGVGSLTVQDGDGTWHWAVGALTPDGKSLMVHHPAGGRIHRVRYAWFNNPEDANLFTLDGLPVTPFEISEADK